MRREPHPRSWANVPTIVLLVAGLLGGSCADRTIPVAASTRPSELVVYAATSTRDALADLAPAYERERGVRLVFNLGASGDLARQIVAAVGADVFLSAGEREMDEVAAAGLVAPGTRRGLLSNRLVVVEPASVPSVFTAPFDPAQLAGPAIERLALAHVEAVPAGRYALEWLVGRGVWNQVRSRVIPGVDARAALAAVEAGGAQAGIVYASDAARSTRARVVYAVPLADGPPISYPVAAIAGRAAESEARAFLAFLATPRARAAFEARGFIVPAGGS